MRYLIIVAALALGSFFLLQPGSDELGGDGGYLLLFYTIINFVSRRRIE
jgi:hypothetical protein